MSPTSGRSPTDLDRCTWTEVAEGGTRRLLAVPLGATEQHGPHLPLGTDTIVAEALAHRLAAERDEVVAAPALPYGSSGEHAGFAGTLSIGRAALEAVVVELVRSADAFVGVVLVSGHGGNAEPIARAVATLTTEGRRVLAWAPRIAGGDAHAGRAETSLLLALAPGLVRLDQAEPGDVRPLAAVIDELRTGGVQAVSANGVLGDPTRASADEGQALLDSLTAELVASVASWCPRPRVRPHADLAFRVDPMEGPVASALLRDLFAEGARVYADRDQGLRPFVDPRELALPSGIFLLAVRDGQPVACGGLRRLDTETAEIKRMYVAPCARGAGVAARLLQELESRAVGLGYQTVRLDTGDRQPAAVRLYRSAGYLEIPDYNANPVARRWFEKDLSVGSRPGHARQPRQ